MYNHKIFKDLETNHSLNNQKTPSKPSELRIQRWIFGISRQILSNFNVLRAQYMSIAAFSKLKVQLMLTLRTLVRTTCLLCSQFLSLKGVWGKLSFFRIKIKNPCNTHCNYYTPNITTRMLKQEVISIFY